MWYNKGPLVCQIIENLKKVVTPESDLRTRILATAEMIVVYFLRPEWVRDRVYTTNAKDTFYTIAGRKPGEVTR